MIKKLSYFVLGLMMVVPFSALAVQITVPSASNYGDWLRGNANGTYTPVATSTIFAPGTFSAFPFTPQSYGNSTSTTLAFLNGFFSSASSTVSGSFHLGLSSGELAINSSGLVYSGATTTAGTGLSYSGGAFNVTGLTTTQFTSANVSQWTNDAGYAAFPFSPTTNFGAVANATSTPIWFKSGIQASTTLNISGIITSAATAANVFPYASTTAISSSGSAYFATSGGGVGVGITNPSHSLQIGPSPASVSANDSFTVASTTYGYFSISGTAANSNVGFVLNQGTATGGSGNGFSVLGIVGTNTDAFYGLSASASGKSSGDILWQDFYGSAFHSIMSVPIGTNNAVFGGLVGIATSTPYSKLSVWGADTTAGHRAFEVTNSASTTEFAVDDAGRTRGLDSTTGLAGVLSPLHRLTLQTGTTTSWTATTSGAYIPTTVAPFSGTIQNAQCSTDASFLGIDIAIASTHLAYFVASTTAGTITFSANNTFTAGQLIKMTVGTTTTSGALLASCTLGVTETP